MKPARSLLSLLLLSASLVAQDMKGPNLSIEAAGADMRFTVAGLEAPFLGGVVLSLSSDLVNYFQGLPPLLSDFVVLGVGFANSDHEFSVQVPQHSLPAGILIYAQGLSADKNAGVLASDVGSFVLDGISLKAN